MILTASRIVWCALGSPEIEGVPGRCGLCGANELPVIDAIGAMPETYNDWDRWHGRDVCQACLAYFRASGRGDTLRTGHILATTERVERPSTDELRAMLADSERLPLPPFVCTIACSYKKHLIPRACVALCRDRFPVTMELETSWIVPSILTRHLDVIEALIAAGHTDRDAVARGRPAARGLRAEEGLRAWRRHEDHARHFAHSFDWRLACRLATNSGTNGGTHVGKKCKRKGS